MSYKNGQLDSIDDLKLLFPKGIADELNWCLFSTSGVHGTYFNLNKIENSLINRLDEDHEDYCSPFITVLVIKPRLVSLGWGNIEIYLDDFSFLRDLAMSSLKEIMRSQIGNL